MAVGLVTRAAALIADHLEQWGVERVFCVPGESFLDLLDALHDSRIDIVTCRHEGGAAMMAQADGALAGRPGVLLVTRGPGACNALAGLHVARQGGTPLLMLVGQVSSGDRGRDAFQELDYRRGIDGIVKRVDELDVPAALSERLSRSWRCAIGDRPGPVALVIPEDHFAVDVPACRAPDVSVPMAYPPPPAIAEVRARLAAAARPLVVAGGWGWSDLARTRLVEFATRFDVPVAVGFRRQNLFPATHDAFAGHLGLGADPALVHAARESDLLLLLGSRFGDITSQGFTIATQPGDGARIVHVHADSAEHGRLYPASLAIVASPGQFLAAMLDDSDEAIDVPSDAAAPTAHDDHVVTVSNASTLAPRRRRGERGSALAHAVGAWSTPPPVTDIDDGYLHPLSVVRAIDSVAPANAVLASGAGNYAAWFHRYARWPGGPTQLAPVSGSMGYGLPAAIAAKLREPARAVIALAGDGCFAMTAQEFATAVHYRVAVVVFVLDNRQYGTIRAHQESRFPGRQSGTALSPIDFAGLATALGGRGVRVTDEAACANALYEALSVDVPSLIHCPIDPAILSPTMTLTRDGVAKR